MGHRRTALMAIDRDDTEIEVEVSGDLCSAEPDVGIMGSYCEDICAKRLDDDQPIELTEKEQLKANELLSDQDYDQEDYDDDRP